MKKIFLFTSIMLVALCFIGCGKSESFDLRLFELKGNVESVKVYYTSSVTSAGKKTRYSSQSDGPVYSFDKKGKIISGYEHDTEFIFSRNKDGYIDTIYLPCDGDGFYSKVYTWKEGLPIIEEFSNIAGYSSITLIYDVVDSCTISKRIEERYGEEGEEWQVRHTYKILNKDANDNWTKRVHLRDDEMWGKIYTLEERVITYYPGESDFKTSSYSTQSYSTLSNKSSGSNSNQYDDSSTKWKEFAETTYRASQFTSEGYQYYAFSYDRTGKGKYIIWWNYLGTDVVEDKMEFSIYKVESEGNYLYLYSYELNSPVKIEIQGSSLYTMNGDRYEIWR